MISDYRMEYNKRMAICKTPREIYDIIKANEHTYRVFGIRTCDQAYKVDDICDDSYNWDDQKPSEEWERLPGVSTTGFAYLWLYDDPTEDDIADDCAVIREALELHQSQMYPGRHIYLIGGWNYTDGPDEAEKIIERGVVLAILH